MKASLSPLEGKYYGTIVEIDGRGSIEVWLSPRDNDDWLPSEREDTTIEQIKEGENHYENRISLRVAQIIVNAINEADGHDVDCEGSMCYCKNRKKKEEKR